MPCSVCQHPKRQEIDQALIAGSATLNALSHKHGPSTSALQRHKAHLHEKMAQIQNRFQDMLREGYLFILNEFLEMVWRVARTAETEGDSRQLLLAIRQGTNIMKFMAKLDGSLTPDTVHHLLASNSLVEPGKLLPTNPQFVAGSRQALAASLFSPCPETEPEVSSLSQADLDLLQQAYSSRPVPEKSGNRPSPARLCPAPKPPAGQRQPAKGKPAGKSGKLPGYSECIIDDVEAYRLVELDKKIAQLDLEALTRGLSPAAGNAKLEAIFDELYDSIPIPKDRPLSEYLHEQSLMAK